VNKDEAATHVTKGRRSAWKKRFHLKGGNTFLF
jgi:hypothetical protein